MNRSKILPHVAFFILIAPAFGGILRAQEASTSLRGTVTDQSGSSVPGAKVTIQNSAVGFSRDTTASKDGAYEFLLLPPATYELSVTATGFKTYIHKQLSLLVSTPATLNIKLQLGEMAQSVTVTEANEPAVNTTDATMGNAFGRTQIERLPFDGRDPVEILSLQPGVLFIDTSAQTGVDKTNDSRSGAVNGGRSDQANVTLDGVDDNDQLNGFAFEGALRTTLDSTEEFRVTTANGNADEGRSSGAQVNLVTKSGTNNFHGSLYDYNRNILGRANYWFNKNTELIANPPLPNHPAPLIRNVFGGSIGGPIKKDRAFFFFNYEGKRQAESAQTGRLVPSDSLRDGVIIYECDPSATCPGGQVQGISQQMYNVPAGFNGLTAAQLASMDTNSVGNGTCLNPSMWAPGGCGPSVAVLQAMQLYPHANSDSFGGDAFNIRSFTFPSPQPIHDNTAIVRLDYNLTSDGNQKLFVRGNYQDDHEFEALNFPGEPATFVDTNGNKGFAVGYTLVINPTHINNFHYGLVRQSLGHNGDNNTEDAVLLRGIDDINAAGTFFTRTTATVVPVNNFIDDFTWIKGKHTLQFGGNFRLVDNERISDANSFFQASTSVLSLGSGSIANQGVSLDPAVFGFPAVNANFGSNYDFAASALMGLVGEIDAVYNRTKTGEALPDGTPVKRHFRAHEYEFYAQDSWRVKPNLTFTFGARYTLLQPPYETNGIQVAPTISLHDYFETRAADQKKGISFNPLISFNLSGQANGLKPYWAWDHKDIAPRLALVWAPSWNNSILKDVFGGPGQSSIRVGYGIYYDHFGEGIVSTFDRNGSFGLTTQETNAFGVLSVDDVPRFVDRTTMPPGLLPLVPKPQGGFPATPTADPTLGMSIGWGLDDKLKTPYSHVIDLSIERDLGHNFTLDVAYVGRIGRRLLDQLDITMPLDLTDPASGMDYFTAATMFSKLSRAGTDINNVPKIQYWEDIFPTAHTVTTPAGVLIPSIGAQCSVGNFPSNPTNTQAMYELFSCFTLNEIVALQQADAFCVPVCPTVNGKTAPLQFFSGQFGSLYSWSSVSTSDYHALEITLRKKMSGGLLFDVNYTLSKSLDIGSDTERINPVAGFNSQIVNSWSPRLQRGVSDFDARHQLNANWVWEIPVGHGRHWASGIGRGLDAVIGGWEISGLARWTSGFPFSVQNGAFFPTNFDLPGQAVQVGPTPKTGAYYVQIPGAQNPTINVFQDPTTAINSFDFPFPGQVGNRNNLRGPGYFSTDMSLQKAWSLGESRSLRFGWDVFNVSNSVRFDAQNSFPAIDTATTFGNFGNTLNDSRKMQFSLRFEF